MLRITFARAALASALVVAQAAHAASDAELSQLRDEIGALRQSYEAYIEALEARVTVARNGVAPGEPHWAQRKLG